MLLIPLLGLGFWPTIVALVIYCQAILVRNVVAGIRSVDPAVLEAARGMGLSGWQILWGVELPLALPVILAGRAHRGRSRRSPSPPWRPSSTPAGWAR